MRLYYHRQRAILYITLLVTILCLDTAKSDQNSASLENKVCPESNDAKHDKCSNTIEDTTCRVYLAESSIPNAGLGVYSAVDLPRNTTVGHAGIVIPVINYADSSRTVLKSYLWQGQGYLLHNEADIMDVLNPGILAAVNGHPGLKNVWWENIPPYTVSSDNAGLHRSKDPGIGAFSTYYNAYTITSVPISAGTELFADYGDHWFQMRGKKFGDLPLSTNYEEANELATSFSDFMTAQKNAISVQEFDKMWKFTRDRFTKSPKTRKLLPDFLTDVKKAGEIGVEKFHAPPGFTRSVDWLKQNGICMDNLRADVSTIPQAGRGAFATRFLPQGSVIAPAPLIQECNPDNFGVYPSVPSGLAHEIDYTKYKKKGKQIITNYCLGHASSTILLCPYGGNTVFINHDSQAPNVQIQWSSHPFHQKDWLNLPVDDVCKRGHAGMMFEYVALRDIQPGEEVLMDYGPEWEKAWKYHLNKWLPGDESYVSASTLNQKETTIKTLQEQKIDPYPDNVYTECFFSFDPIETKPVQKDGIWHVQFQYIDTDFDSYSCTIYKRKTINGIDHYAAGMHLYEGGVEEDHEIIVTNIPRSAIKFGDEMYTTDMHLEGVFRHEIMIPDEIFPDAWKNKK